MRETKQEAAREKVTRTELEVNKAEAVAARENATTDRGRLESHPQNNKEPFLERQFQKMIKKWGLTKIVAIKAVRKVTARETAETVTNVGALKSFRKCAHF